MSAKNQAVQGNWKKNIILFLGSQTISLFGSSLVQYAIMWHITLSTQSGLMMTFYILAAFLPTFLLSPFAGVWADRYNRKRLIIISDGMIALATLLLAILYLFGYDPLWLLFVIAAVRALGGGVQVPTVSAILPQIVPEEKLTQVNGANGSIQALITLLGPMASGALMTFTPLETIFFIDVLTAAIAILILMIWLHIPDHEKAAQQQSTGYFDDFKQGLVYINSQRYLKQFFLFFALFFVLAAPVSFLTPLQVTRSFGPDVWRLTAIEVSFSIGMMLGGIVIAAWGGFKNRTHTMALASLLFGFCTFALGVIPNFWVYLAFMATIGITMPMFQTPSTVLLQEKVEGNYLGRVFGVVGMISTSMMPLGMLIFGPLADLIPVEWMLIGTGVVLFFLSFVLVGSKELVKAGQPAR